jgi:hypothetical protein
MAQSQSLPSEKEIDVLFDTALRRRLRYQDVLKGLVVRMEKKKTRLPLCNNASALAVVK